MASEIKNADQGEAVKGCLWAFVGFFIVWPIGICAGAFTLTKLWAWFIVPQFDAKPLTFVMAIGLDLVVGIVAPQPFQPSDMGHKKEISETVLMVVSRTIAFPLLLLGLGFIASRFV